MKQHLFVEAVAKLKKHFEQPSRLAPRYHKAKKVLVRFKCVHDRKGTTVSVDARPKAYPITGRYQDGRVRTITGDVFEVAPFNSQEAGLIAIR